MRTIRFWVALASTAFVMALVGPSMLVSAASGTPTVAPKAAATGHPVHIHDGSCAKLGAVVYPLTDLTAPATATAASATKTTAPAKAATPATAKEIVAASTTKVKATLKELEQKPYAINAHESKAKITNYIACGDITGAIKNGKLTVTLKQLNKSGLEGDAVLTDNGDGTTTVVIQLSKATGA